MIEPEEYAFIKTVFTHHNWADWTLEDFWSENGINWEQVTLDEDLFYEMEDEYDTWDEWDHERRMYELDAVAEETVAEMKAKNMDIIVERDEKGEEIFILGLNKDLIPIAKALLLWK